MPAALWYPPAVLQRLRPLRANPVRQLELAVLAMAALIVLGSGGYVMLAGADPLDALLMTVVTISTVGYQESVPLTTPALKLYTIGLIVTAVLVTAWAVRSAAELLFAEYLWTHIGRQRMQSRIDHLSGHAIVCGYGRMGRSVTTELEAEGLTVVVVEPDPALAQELAAAGRLVVDGDATRDDTLRRAGIERAGSLVVAANSDAVNVLIVLSAHFLNPRLTIAARADYPDAASKLERAGASYVLQPHGIGATHLALAVTHPVVEDVLNHLLPRQGNLDLSQLRIEPASQLVGRSLAEVQRQGQQLLVLAVLRAGVLSLPPAADLHLAAGDILVVAGSHDAVRGLDRLA